MAALLRPRLIGVLLVTRNGVVQSEQFRHTHVIHYDPQVAMRSFALWALDEIVVLNVDRAGWPTTEFAEVLRQLASKCFLPISAGGGIREPGQAVELLRAGAEKVVVNSLLFESPQLVRTISDRYGRQCVVASGDFVKRGPRGRYFSAIRAATTATDISLSDWIINAEAAGVGEYFINSVEFDGARNGYDLSLLSVVKGLTSRPVIMMGGVRTWEHLSQGLMAGADAVALANQLHYVENSGRKAKNYLIGQDWNMRPAESWEETRR